MDCPEWLDHDEHNSAACFRGIEAVVSRACALARTCIPNEKDIASWHREAFKSFAPLLYYAGNYRQDDPARICLGINVAVGEAPGADYSQVLREMRTLCRFMERELRQLDLSWPSLTHADRIKRLATIIGFSVGCFVKIHPFINGNGRTSRILWCALLSRMGLPPHVTVLRRPAQPYGHVMKCAMTGDYGPAVAMVFSALAAGQATSADLPSK